RGLRVVAEALHLGGGGVLRSLELAGRLGGLALLLRRPLGGPLLLLLATDELGEEGEVGIDAVGRHQATPAVRRRMMLRAPPARNQSICSWFSVWSASKSMRVPSGFTIRHRTGAPGVRSARPRNDSLSS